MSFFWLSDVMNFMLGSCYTVQENLFTDTEKIVSPVVPSDNYISEEKLSWNLKGSFHGLQEVVPAGPLGSGVPAPAGRPQPPRETPLPKTCL